MKVHPIPSHPIQWKLLDLAQKKDIGTMSFRALGREVGDNLHPEKIKHHLGKLEAKGFLRFYIDKDTFERKCHIDRDKAAEARKFLLAQQP